MSEVAAPMSGDELEALRRIAKAWPRTWDVPRLLATIDAMQAPKKPCEHCDGRGDVACLCLQGLSGCRHTRYPDLYPPPGERPTCPSCGGTGRVLT